MQKGNKYLWAQNREKFWYPSPCKDKLTCQNNAWYAVRDAPLDFFLGGGGVGKKFTLAMRMKKKSPFVSREKISWNFQKKTNKKKITLAKVTKKKSTPVKWKKKITHWQNFLLPPWCVPYRLLPSTWEVPCSSSVRSASVLYIYFFLHPLSTFL